MKKFFLAAGLASLMACATTNNDAKTRGKTNEPAVQSAVSSPMPAFSLGKLGGGALASTELAGKPLMINFWHPS